MPGADSEVVDPILNVNICGTYVAPVVDPAPDKLPNTDEQLSYLSDSVRIELTVFSIAEQATKVIRRQLRKVKLRALSKY